MPTPERPGRRTAICLHLTDEGRATLEAWQRRSTLPAGQVRRARVILLLADGWTITRISRQVGISRRHIYRLVARYLEGGTDGLLDQARNAWPRRRTEGEA